MALGCAVVAAAGCAAGPGSTPILGDADDAGGAPDGAVASDGGGDGRGRDAGGAGGSCGSVVVGGAATCAGRFPDRVFRHALCVCEGGIALVETDSYDSSAGMPRERAGAPVGVNGIAIVGGASAPTQIGGSLAVGAGLDVWALDVHGDLSVGDELNVFPEAPYALHVLRDARVVGPLNRGRVVVDRDLYQPAGVTNGATLTVSGATHREPVVVDPPCDCSDASRIDTAGIVAAGATDNDNAAAGIEEDAFASVTASTEATLGCGRYYLRGVNVGAGGALTLHLTGHVSLLVEGTFDTEADGRIVVDVGPSAQLDLFVHGEFSGDSPPGSPPPTGSILLGSPDRAAAVRVYVAPIDPERMIWLRGETFVGNLYAPGAPVVSISEVSGSIFAGSVNLNGVAIHYDRAVIDASETCEDPPPETCTTCADCSAGTACSGSMCATGCTTDADCCAPLVCYPGEGCGQLLF